MSIKVTGKYQDGFGSVEVLGVLLVVAVLTAIALMVHSHTHGHKEPIKTSTAPATSQTSAQPTTTTTEPLQPATQYLVIKEWGVELPLSDSIEDAYYVANSSSHGFDGSTNQVYLGLKSLDAEGCDATNISPSWMIFRAKPTEVDPVTNRIYPQEYPNGVMISGYFYAYQSVRNDYCKAPQATLQSVGAAFLEAQKRLTVAP